MAYSLVISSSPSFGVAIDRRDYPTDGLGDVQTFPFGVLTLRYGSSWNEQEQQFFPSGQIEVVRNGTGAAIAVFNVDNGSVNGFDHDGDVFALIVAVNNAFAGSFFTLQSESIAVGETSSTFDCRGLTNCIVFCSVFDIDETVTLRADISITGEDGTWIAQANYAAQSNENFTLTLPVAPFVRLTFVSRTSGGSPTIAVTYYGVKA